MLPIASAITSQKKQTKDLIIEILADQFPLTIGKIHSELTKKYKYDGTYQAVRKCVNLLAEQKILDKINETEYEVNKTWITETKQFVDNLESHYFQKKKRFEKLEISDEISVYTFLNLIEMDKFWVKIQQNWIVENLDKDVNMDMVWEGPHSWWVLGLLDNEDKILEIITQSKFRQYWLNISNTFLDRWASKFYQGKNLHYKSLKKNSDNSSYFSVFGDLVLQTNYPKHVVEKLEKFYSNINDISEINLKELISILREDISVKLTVMRNPVIAENLRNEVLKHFF